MSTRITRRRFLEGTLAVVCVGAGYIFWNRREAVRRQIRDHWSYLQLEPGSVRRFLKDYELANGRGSAQTAALVPLAMKFLLSTDFFQEGADQNRTLRYARFRDPYVNPCYNPLASFN